MSTSTGKLPSPRGFSIIAVFWSGVDKGVNQRDEPTAGAR